MQTKTYSDNKIAAFNIVKNSMTQENWTEIETSITNETAKLGVLCLRFNVPPDIFRSWLVERFGERVEFKRGPKGGIRFRKEQA